LANKLAMSFATKICASFPETLAYIPAKKAVLTGTPIRPELAAGNAAKGLNLCGFTSSSKPVLLIMGGSLGAAAINNCVREALPQLCERYRIIHLCGRGHVSEAHACKEYAQFEFSDDMPHLYAAADIIVSRAGANSIFEFLALRKPHLLIPLPKSASRGDQILNAASFKKQGFSAVLPEEELSATRLLEELSLLYNNRTTYQTRMAKHELSDGIAGVMATLT